MMGVVLTHMIQALTGMIGKKKILSSNRLNLLSRLVEHYENSQLKCP